MPVPNAKGIKMAFDDALKTYEQVGPEFAVNHVIERDGLSATDIALAWLVPEALAAKSEMTKSEKTHFDAEMKAKEVAKKEAAKEEKAAEKEEAATSSVRKLDTAEAGSNRLKGDGSDDNKPTGDANPHDIDANSDPSARAAASKNATVAGPAGGDLNPKDGSDKKPPVGGDVAPAPKK